MGYYAISRLKLTTNIFVTGDLLYDYIPRGSGEIINGGDIEIFKRREIGILGGLSLQTVMLWVGSSSRRSTLSPRV